MDSNKVRILLRVIEAGSMMRIAEEEGYTPSGLTQMMNSIERELDIKLLKRNNQGVALTCEGQSLLPLLKRYTALEDKINAEIIRIKTSNSYVIRIGAYASIAKNWMPEIIREFCQKNQDTTIELTAFGRPDAYRALETGELDIVFAGRDRNARFDFTPLKKDCYYAVLPPHLIDDPDSQTFSIKDLEKYPFIMPSFSADTEVQQALEHFDISPKSLAVVADNAVIIAMVASGLGVSMLSELVLKGNNSNVLLLPIHPQAYRELGMATRPQKELSDIKKDFIAFVRGKKL